MLLNDRVCVITGAASARGIGKATARLFADQGARVAILDLDAGQAEEAARDIGPGHLGLACDVTDRAACSAAADEIVARLGRIDVLVNNAGITQPLKIMEIGPENYDARHRREPARHALHEPGGDPGHARRRAPARSCACRRSPPSAAAASSAARITAPPRPACLASPRPWRGSSAPTASG